MYVTHTQQRAPQVLVDHPALISLYLQWAYLAHSPERGTSPTTKGLLKENSVICPNSISFQRSQTYPQMDNLEMLKKGTVHLLPGDLVIMRGERHQCLSLCLNYPVLLTYDMEQRTSLGFDLSSPTMCFWSPILWTQRNKQFITVTIGRDGDNIPQVEYGNLAPIACSLFKLLQTA